MLLLTRPHLPVCPLGLRWNVVNECVSRLCLLHTIHVPAVRSEVHPGGADHFLRMAQLGEALAVIVSFVDRLHGHLLNERRYSALVALNQAILHCV